MKPTLNCILVIDDDEPTNFFTRMILEDAGSADHIRIMQTGKDALYYIAESARSENEASAFIHPDLIFLDINMPAMDGWEFLQAYRKLDITRKTIIVMLTTSQFPEDKSRAEEMPEISGFENKPLTAEKVAAAIQKYFTVTDAE